MSKIYDYIKNRFGVYMHHYHELENNSKRIIIRVNPTEKETKQLTEDGWNIKSFYTTSYTQKFVVEYEFLKSNFNKLDKQKQLKVLLEMSESKPIC